jgi:hypothetical protein
MELNINGKNSLDILRDKILANNIKWDKEEQIHLQTIYQAITGKVLSLNCNGCWLLACNIIRNYINYYETKPTKEVLKTEIVFASNPIDSYTVKQLKALLKEKHIAIPHNASRSVLIELING